MKGRNRKGSQGFTLVELLVVVSIIALLAVIAVPKLMTTLDKTRDSRASADLASITAALDKFYFDNTFYPVYLSTLIKTGYLKQSEFKNAHGKLYFYAVDNVSVPEVWDPAARAFSTAGAAKAYSIADPGKTPLLANATGGCSLKLLDVNAGNPASICEGLGPTNLAWNTNAAAAANKVTTDAAGFPDANNSLRGFSNKVFTE